MNELMILTAKALEARDKALDEIAERQMFEKMVGGDSWMEVQEILAEQTTSDLDEEGFEL